ncbi:hypothetical protein KFL_003350080 [Klebsormidium nitens]|uniref:Uncharacterized protein n=1 Tax=Klebsormidium nitens TaxID=105231 RepID=A0A0U9HKP1_KLENI|nr:hypothetical protein KFL_003350080 [Klebsormidium nitens]|eukprot:GAQ87158.1 hypothetical protein KFL_003350080 [Klebsormidium nitens]
MDGQKRKRRKKGRTHLSTPRKQGRKGRHPVAEDADILDQQAVVLEANNDECSSEPESCSISDGAFPGEDTPFMGGAKPQVLSGESEPIEKIAPSNQEGIQKQQGSEEQRQEPEQERQLGQSVQKVSLPPLPIAPQADIQIAALPGHQSHQRLKPLRPLGPAGNERGATQTPAGDATQPAKKCACDVYKFCRQVGALPLSEDVAAALAAFQHDDTTRGRKEEAVRYFLSQVMRQVLGFNVPFLHKLCALAEAANARSQCEATKGAGLSTRTESLCNLVTTCLPLKPATSAERALGTVLLPLECVAASPFIFKLYKELNMSKGAQKRAPT